MGPSPNSVKISRNFAPLQAVESDCLTSQRRWLGCCGRMLGWAGLGWAGLVQRCRPRQPPPGPGSCCQHTWTQTCSAQLYAGAGHCPAQPRDKICVFLMLIHISVNQKLFQNSQMSIQHPVISLIAHLFRISSVFLLYLNYIQDILMGTSSQNS